MNLRQMEVFRAVMVTGSINGAAALLHVSAPAVSRLIKYLQVSLGVPLFERSRGRIVATDDARHLHEEIDRIYRGVESVQAVALSLKSGTGRTLRIVCSPSVGLAVMPIAVAQLRQAKPQLKVTLDVLPLPALTDALLRHQADVGLSLIEPSHPSLATRILGKSRLVVAMPLGHPLAELESVALKDLVGHVLIRFHGETTQGRTLDELLQKAGIDLPRDIVVRIARVAWALAETGAGLAIVDELTASAHGTSRIVIRPLKVKTRYPVSMIWNKDWPLNAASLALEELAQAALHRALGR